MAREDVRFDSAGYASEDEAFLAYERLYATGSDVVRGEGPFRARVIGHRLDGILLFERELAGVVHVREDRVARDKFDHIVATLVVEGEMTGSARSGFDRAVAGEIAFVDTRRGNRTSIVSARLVTAAIGRDLVEAAVGNVAGLHGHVLRPPEALVLGDYLVSLVRHAGQGIALDEAGYARALVDLLSATLPRERDAGADLRRRDYLRRQAADRVIAAALADPGLTSAMIAARTGLSRSSLYRLFERHGGVTQVVTARRVDAVRSAIEGGSLETEGALATRFGFADAGALDRAFRRAVGVGVGAFRTSVFGGGPEAETAHRRWDGWISELL